MMRGKTISQATATILFLVVVVGSRFLTYDVPNLSLGGCELNAADPLLATPSTRNNSTTSAGLATKQVQVKNYSSKEVLRQSPVKFIKQGFGPGQVEAKDAFSATWWQSTKTFLSVNIDLIGSSPEGASFEVFHQKYSQVRLTRDWLDLSVEHMSKWWKVLLYTVVRGSGKERDRILEIFKEYIQRRKPYPLLRVPQATLVVIAYLPSGAKEERGVLEHSLAATLASLLEVGMGRIVVTGRFKEEKSLVQQSFDMLPEYKSRLTFCVTANSTTNDPITPYNVPKGALLRLREVLLGKATEPELKCWLGDDAKKHDRWKYLFLGEPDLLLHTRPSSIQAFGHAMDAGLVLAPHRLQPIPHESDFRGVAPKTHVLPSVGQFAQVQELDSSTWSCCDDDSNLKPGAVLYDDCGKFWWQCGFHDAKFGSQVEIQESHKRLLPYTLLRLTDGTRMPFAGAESGRRCFPQQGVCQEGNTSALLPLLTTS